MNGYINETQIDCVECSNGGTTKSDEIQNKTKIQMLVKYLWAMKTNNSTNYTYTSVLSVNTTTRLCTISPAIVDLFG